MLVQIEQIPQQLLMRVFFVAQTNDYCAVQPFLKDQTSARYPGARRTLLKTGGDFPFLSRVDEVNLHAQVSSSSCETSDINLNLIVF